MDEPTTENGKQPRRPVAPYLAVGISTVVHGVGERKDIAQNLDTIEDAIHAAMGIISINMPVKLIALAEGALTGFTDEAFAKAEKAGVKFKPFKVDRKILPETASTQGVNWVFAPAAMTVHKDFPEQAAYEITKFMMKSASKLPKYHAMLNVVASPEALLGDWTAQDLHPGAARAYREAGLLK